MNSGRARKYRVLPLDGKTGRISRQIERYRRNAGHADLVGDPGFQRAPPSVYLRRMFHEDGKVKHEKLGSLSDLPRDLIAWMKWRLESGKVLVDDDPSIEVLRTLPHGHVEAVAETLKNIGLPEIHAARPCGERDLVMAMIVDRVISPRSRLSCSHGMNSDTAQNTRAEELRVDDVDEFHDAMDWLLARQTRINQDFRDIQRLDWISTLRSEQIRSLIAAGKIGRSLLDEKDLAEITSEELLPGERFIVCRNPLLADERARKREELLQATERELGKIVTATQKKSRPLHGQDAIALKVESVVNKFKMQKHFIFVITDDRFRYSVGQRTSLAKRPWTACIRSARASLPM